MHEMKWTRHVMHRHRCVVHRPLSLLCHPSCIVVSLSCCASMLCIVHCRCRHDTMAMAICITSSLLSCRASCHPVVRLVSLCRVCMSCVCVVGCGSFVVVVMSWVVGHCCDAVAMAMRHVVVIVMGRHVMRLMGRGSSSLLCHVLCVVVHRWCQCRCRKCKRETYLQSIPTELWT